MTSDSNISLSDQRCWTGSDPSALSAAFRPEALFVETPISRQRSPTRVEPHVHFRSSPTYALLRRWCARFGGDPLPGPFRAIIVTAYKKMQDLPTDKKDMRKWHVHVYDKLPLDTLQQDPQYVILQDSIETANANAAKYSADALAAGQHITHDDKGLKRLDGLVIQAKNKMKQYYQNKREFYLESRFQTWYDLFQHEKLGWAMSNVHNSLCHQPSEQSQHEQLWQHASGQDYDDFSRFTDCFDFRKYFFAKAAEMDLLAEFLYDILEEAVLTFSKVGIFYIEYSISPSDLHDWADILPSIVQRIERENFPCRIRFLAAFRRVKYQDYGRDKVQDLKGAGNAIFLNNIRPNATARAALLREALADLILLQVTLDKLGHLVVGLDIVGHENKGAHIPLVEPEFIQFLSQQLLRNSRFGCRIHAGEAWDKEWGSKGLLASLQAVRFLRRYNIPVRIGHGVELATLINTPDAFGPELPFSDAQDLLHFLREEKVYIELCLTSNLVLRGSSNLPPVSPAIIPLIEREKLPFIFGSDNPSFWGGVSLYSMALHFAQSQGVTYEQIRRDYGHPFFEIDQAQLAENYGMNLETINLGIKSGFRAAFSDMSRLGFEAI